MDAQRREKLERALIVPLVIVFLVVVVNVMRRAGIGGSSVKANAAQAAARPHTQAPRMERILEQAEGMALTQGGAAAQAAATVQTAALTYAASSLRDPLESLLAQAQLAQPAKGADEAVRRPQPQEAAAMPSLTVQGAWWGDGGGAAGAIISGEVCRVGDTVQGATVRAIGPKGVTVEFRGKAVGLTMSRIEQEKASSRSVSRVTADRRRR